MAHVCFQSQYIHIPIQAAAVTADMHVAVSRIHDSFVLIFVLKNLFKYIFMVNSKSVSKIYTLRCGPANHIDDKLVLVKVMEAPSQ